MTLIGMHCKNCGNNPAPSDCMLDANSTIKRLLCPYCGHTIHDTSESERARLDLYEKKNMTTVKRFTIHEQKAPESHVQYFVVYGREAGHMKVHGLTDSAEVARTMSYFRSTGVLRLNHAYSPYRTNYEYIQDVDYVFITHTEHIMSRVMGMQEIDVNDLKKWGEDSEV